MSCSLPHTVEEIKDFVQNQCDIDDVAGMDAIIAVSKLFNKEYHAKQALKEQYVECKDIPPERRVIIQEILEDKSMKDLMVEHKLWRAMQKIQNNISHKNLEDKSMKDLMVERYAFMFVSHSFNF
ncbi:hypothetical protein Tco_0427607 [Tanacetum coccineum]